VLGDALNAAQDTANFVNAVDLNQIHVVSFPSKHHVTNGFAQMLGSLLVREGVLSHRENCTQSAWVFYHPLATFLKAAYVSEDVSDKVKKATCFEVLEHS
jgi:hypothetical protein